MHYIVVEIQTNLNGTVGNIVTAYADRNQAESKYHTVLAAAAVSSLPSHACVLMTNEGHMIASAAYHHQQES